MRISALLIVCILLTQSLMAQDSADTGLDPVTVTASITPLQASKTGRNIVVLRGEQFYQLPVHSIDELLRYIPGVEMQARGPMGSQSDLVIRGGTFQQVLVILDGIRLNDPLTGHFSSYIPIAPSEIDRIEVLKGASSAIYGTEAVGGVIHIITKSFANQRKQRTTAQIAVGEYGLFNASAGGTFTTKKGIVSAGIQSNHATGQQQRGTKGFLDASTISASYRHQWNDKWYTAARVAYDYRDFAAQNFYTTFASDTARERVITQWNHLQTGYSGKRLKWRLDAGYKTTDDRYSFNKRSAPNQNNSSVWQALSVADIELSAKSSITTGLQFVQKQIKSNDRGNHSVSQTGVFAVLHQQIGQYIQAEPALRLDIHQRSGVELLPQLNLSYKRSFYQLRGSVGRTIRDADFTERFNNYNRTLVASGSIGNPNLNPETSWSYEAGADVWLAASIKIAAGWFSREQRNLIDFVTTPYAQMPRQVNLVPTGTYALAKNIASVQTNGFETDITYRKQWKPQHWLQGNAGLVWLNSNSNGATPGFYISSHARFLFNYGIVYQYHRITIAVNGLYKQRREQKANAINASITPNYWLTNVRIDGHISSHLSVFVQADNVGDVSYSDLLGSVMPRRWLMGGVKWNR